MHSKTGKPKKILLVDDEEIIRDALKRFLEEKTYTVTSVTNGKLARDLLSIEAFDLVLSDIHMPGSQIGGMELLNYVRQHYPKIPVVLMTGFATLAETAEAQSNGVAGFIAKPFNREELAKIIENLCEVSSPTTAVLEPVDVDEDYSKLSIDDFISGKQIKFNVYVRISKVKYVKIAHKGEDLDPDRVHNYKVKGIQHLYLTKQDFLEYMKFNLGLSRAVKESTKIEPVRKMRFLKHTVEVILERVHSEELEQESFGDARAAVETMTSFLMESSGTFDLIAALNQHSDFLYAHSLGVSIYAVMIGKKLEWHSTASSYKLSMSGLLHDIGKKEIAKDIILKSRLSMTTDEVKIFETHPTRGMEILSRVPTVPEDILQIINQHHERDSGTGYPNRLMKLKIHPLAKVIAVADEFCKLTIEGPDHGNLTPLKAVERLEQLHAHSLDGAAIAALKKSILK